MTTKTPTTANTASSALAQRRRERMARPRAGLVCIRILVSGPTEPPLARTDLCLGRRGSRGIRIAKRTDVCLFNPLCLFTPPKISKITVMAFLRLRTERHGSSSAESVQRIFSSSSAQLTPLSSPS